VSRIGHAAQRLRRGVAVVAVLLGCGALSEIGCGGLSDFATFLGEPFGDVSGGVRALDQAELETLMAELMLRFRSYLTLREAIPFESLAPEQCITESRDTGASFFFVADLGCVFGEAVSPARGTVAVTQQQLAMSPNGVFRFDVDYRQVELGLLAVDGTERVTETEGSDGASVRKLDLVQDGRTFEYEFRAGLLDGETPVFDYQLAGPDGAVLARISNAVSAGGFVSVLLTGLDGTLACEVRNTLWTPERLPRGSCDNGVVFGLPDP